MTFFEIFLFAFNAIMPVVLLILLGWGLKRIKFLSDGFLSDANKFVFNVALPVLLFYNVYNIKDFGEINWGTVGFAGAVILVLFVFGLVFCNILTRDRRQKGVIWQAFYRSNFAIIGLPLAEALGGIEGVATASVLSAFSIPVFNALAVVSLSVYTSSDGRSKVSVKEILMKIVKNPLIIGVFAGMCVLAVRQFAPVDFTIKDNMPFIYKPLEMLASTASPVALVVLGGRFRFSAVKEMKLQVAGGTLARIVFAPVLGLGLSILLSFSDKFSFGAGHYAAFLALFGSPVAVSSAIMAAQMDNDDTLADQILVWTSIFSILTVFVFVVILKKFSFI